MVDSPLPFALAATPPNEAAVVSVQRLGIGQSIWTFDRDVAVTSGPPPLGVGMRATTTGGVQDPTGIAQAASNASFASYAGDPIVGQPWSTVGSILGVTPQPSAGQGGTIT